MGRESRHSITGSSTQSLNQAAIRCQLVAFSFGESSGEESVSKVIQVVGRIHLVSVSLWAPGFCWLLAGDCPQVLYDTHTSGGYSQLLALWASPTWLLISLSSLKSSSPSLSRYSLMKCNVITTMTSHYLCHILLVRSKSQTPFSDPTKEEGILQNCKHDEVGITGAHFRHMHINTEGRAIIILILLMRKQRHLAKFTWLVGRRAWVQIQKVWPQSPCSWPWGSPPHLVEGPVWIPPFINFSNFFLTLDCYHLPSLNNNPNYPLSVLHLQFQTHFT